MPDSVTENADRLLEHLQQLERLHGHLTIELGFGLVINLIAQLQLALRHPLNTGPSGAGVRAFLDNLIARLDASSPGVGDLIRLGYDPRHDVPRTR